MQNNNQSNHFWKEKGAYILLALCLVAVGVSGWFFLNGAVEEAEELQPVLSVPVEEEKPAKDKTAETVKPEQDAQQEETQTPQQPKPEARETVLPVSGDVLYSYAMDKLTYNPTTKDWRVHTGVDLAAQPGTPVKAAKAGTVASIYDDDAYGMTVTVSHEGDYVSYYSNLDPAVTVEVGQTVAAGDSIGSVGTTALLESGADPHLHFAVTCGGTPIDPAGFLY